MNVHKGLIFIIILLTTGLNHAYSTHNRAGEITYTQTGPLTVRVTITTYTKASSVAADRDSLELFWGDGTSQFVRRTNGTGEILPDDIKLNLYIAEHTYPGRTTYTVYFTDPNRVGNILNINFPNSIDVLFFLSTTFTLMDVQFQGINNSVRLLNPPLDRACVGRRFMHNPGAYDPDGDSISYELVQPLEGLNTPVPNYRFPNEIIPGPGNQISLNPITGDFVWESPPQPGEYNIAIAIKEWRNGLLITTIIRDMQILVNVCENFPPIIENERNLCVVAGDSIDLEIGVDDPDTGQRVTLTATGGPLLFTDSPATVNPVGEPLDISYTANFSWQTNCNHLTKNPHQVLFRAIDNGSPTRLTTFRTLRISVAAPPPEDFTAEAVNDFVFLSWEYPYLCYEENTVLFRGFSIWRREGSKDLEQDTCSPGLTGGPYQRIFFNSNQTDGERYFFIDSNVEPGKTYCYRIQAEFAQSTPTGNPFNRIEGMHSEEICLQLLRDLPLITKVSVEETSDSAGEIHVRWYRPLTEDFDEQRNPGPYTFELQKELNNSGIFTTLPGGTIIVNELIELEYTNYFNTGINTFSEPHNYRVVFKTGLQAEEYGFSPEAQSVLLSIAPTDQRNLLTWEENVPWSNKLYKIFRQRNGQAFEEIGSSTVPFFNDTNLQNGVEYCYYVETTGTYGFRDIEDPIINLSQRACAMPEDNVAPCSPPLVVSNVCDNDNPNILDGENIFNRLRWGDPNFGCDRVEMIAQYRVYFLDHPDADPILLAEINAGQPREFLHYPESVDLAGCYFVTAVDMSGNESSVSNVTCKDNCPLYNLPNTFTPNGDGANDIFRPIKNFFIDRVEFKVYNIWGNLVFETTDPEINWDGRNLRGDDLSEGSYFYICTIYESRAEGIVELKDQLKGNILLIR
jgi:gliding motility-associated-like protein